MSQKLQHLQDTAYTVQNRLKKANKIIHIDYHLDFQNNAWPEPGVILLIIKLMTKVLHLNNAYQIYTEGNMEISSYMNETQILYH